METDRENIRKKVLGTIDMTREPENSELHQIIDRVIEEEIDCKYITIEERFRIHKDIFNSIKGLGIIEDLLEDDDITEIMVNGTADIFIEREEEFKGTRKWWKARGD
jgi:pilus assembly protein CpaF